MSVEQVKIYVNEIRDLNRRIQNVGKDEKQTPTKDLNDLVSEIFGEGFKS